MSKQKKKRNKAYKGADARTAKPQTIRVEAVKRGKVQQWWLDRKKVVKPIAIAVAVVAIIVWLIFELVRMVL